MTSWELGISIVTVISVRLIERCNSFEEGRSIISHRVVHAPKIVVGVDTHKEEHVAVVIDKLGARMGQLTVPTTNTGYVALERWARTLGEIQAFGVEGTGSYGAGLARLLRGQGHIVIEVNRPDRSTRRRLGKSDSTDTEMAARSVLAGVARDQPKSGVEEVEMIRMLKSTKDLAMKGRTQAINQMNALVVTAPVKLREVLSMLASSQLEVRCSRWPNAN